MAAAVRDTWHPLRSFTWMGISLLFLASAVSAADVDAAEVKTPKPARKSAKKGSKAAPAPKPAEKVAESTEEPGPDVVDFQPMNMSEPATSMALSEDGRFLVVTHQAADTVTVWDAATRQLVKSLETSAPRSVLCRGDGIYVANFGQGTISYFSAKNDWELVNQFEVHKPDIKHLSAARGPAFKGLLLATCHPSKSAPGPAAIYSVDTKRDKVKELGDIALASMSCDGKTVLTQGSFNRSPSGEINVYNSAEFLAKNAKPIAQGGIQQTPFVFQAHPGSFWIGDHIVFAGTPIQLLKDTDLGDIIIPDQAQRVIYPLTKERIFARRLDTNLTEIGDRKVSFPSETEKKFEGIHHTIHRRRDYLLDHPIAWTEGPHLRLFVLDINRNVVLAAVTPAFATPGNSVAGKESESDSQSASKQSPGAAPGPDKLGLPTRLAVDEKLSLQLKGPENAEYELLTGPDGMSLTKSGQLTWTAKSDQVGVQKLKIRIKDGKKISFARPSIEVLDKDVAPTVAGTEDPLEKFARVDLDADRFELTPGLGYRNLLLLQGDRLRVLDADGITISSDVTLPQRYHRIAERAGHYVALSQQPPHLDVIDKQTLKVKKSLPIEKAGVRVLEVMDFALHPQRPQAFVSIKHDVDLPRYRILIIDETKGAVDALADLIGTWVEVDPAGRYLYAGYKDIYARGSRFHINPGFRIIETPQYGNVDWLITYELRGRTPKVREVETKAGGNGSDIRLSADGQRMTYLSHVGTPLHSGNLLGWNPAKLSDEPVNYVLKGRGVTTQLAFHPTLKLVAVPGNGSAVLLDRESGKLLENRLQLTAAGLGNIKVDDLMFAPDGKSLIFVCNASPEGSYLRRVGLRLSPEETATAAKGVVAPVAKAATEKKPVDRDEFDALSAPKQLEAMSPKEISRRYMKSVVLVKSDEGSGTGFLVGRQGYILTCAHVLPAGDEATVTCQLVAADKEKAVTAVAEVLWQDEEQDVALLKIPSKVELSPVSLAEDAAVESGEEATVIGNPGLGDAILTHTLTTGVVSNPAREIDGQTFIQTSAAVNPGSSGGPMFNSRGQVIGLVVLKAKIEGAAFAIPVSVLRRFLENQPPAAE